MGGVAVKDHMGKHNWIAQRVTGTYILLFVLYVFAWYAIEAPLTVEDWIGFINDLYFQILSSIFSLTLIYHSWLGIWTVITDYVAESWRPTVMIQVQILHVIYLIWLLLLIWSW